MPHGQTQNPLKKVLSAEVALVPTTRGHARDRTARQFVFLRVDVVFGEGEAHGSSTLKVTSPWV